jgi:hypothetical protein
MAEYLRGEKVGLPKREAVVIIAFVQERGCSLRGTAAEASLADFIGKGSPDPSEKAAAEVAMDAIRYNRVLPNGPDELGRGSCTSTHSPPPPAPVSR